MSDEFGQLVRGLHGAADTVVSTDTYLGIVGADDNATPKFRLLQFVDATGELKVTKNIQYNIDVAAGANDTGNLALAIRDDVLASLTPIDGDYVGLRVNSVGALWVQVANTSIAVTASDLDIRNLDYSTDNVAIKGSTGNQLVVNADGSINVSTSGAADSAYVYNSVTLVKDTVNTVVTVSPGATQYYKSVMVSGAGLCEWQVMFGATGFEAVIMSFWTTPSHPTEYVDIPDSLKVLSTQTLKVMGINREKAASVASDFTGHGTLVRQA